MHNHDLIKIINLLDLAKHAIKSIKEDIKVDRKAAIELHVRRLISRKFPYVRVKDEYTEVYWSHLRELTQEVQSHVEFGLGPNGELGVIAIHESFNELTDMLNVSGIATTNNMAENIENIIEAIMVAKNSYQLLEE